jgi:hypothetical protein
MKTAWPNYNTPRRTPRVRKKAKTPKRVAPTLDRLDQRWVKEAKINKRWKNEIAKLQRQRRVKYSDALGCYIVNTIEKE